MHLPTTMLSLVIGIIYLVLIIFTVVRILLDTNSTPKTLGYLLLVLMIPVFGIVIYFSMGINYRHSGLRNKLILEQLEFDKEFISNTPDENNLLPEKYKNKIENFSGLVSFLGSLGGEQLSENNFKLLFNGEEKFPEVILALESARHFIHIEYYNWENDTRGNQIKEVLLRKAGEGIKVRVLYDDYACRKIRRNIIKELKKGGVAVVPQIKVKLFLLLNRLNHRDHRKIIIVDGRVGFTGGINISDRYDNSIDTGLYWRDTHVKIIGPLVNSMQRHFIVRWNCSQDDKLAFSKELFPDILPFPKPGTEGLGQVVAGGPIYPMSNIMLTYNRIFTLAKKKLYITNPYFIPSESILDALMQAAISGTDVRLILPFKSDSLIVGAASKFYFPELLKAGVKIYLYKKGFVHAKTVVADSLLSVVGTANMDIRSFNLNFEIMAVIYGEDFASQLEKVFLDDLEECLEITKDHLAKTGTLKMLGYAIARLVSNFL
jgi:cardiolipin synthase A/B